MSPSDFKHYGMSAFSAIIHLLGVSVLAFCIARRTARENLLSFKGWSRLPWVRWLVILVFFDSWLFLFFSGILINGTHMTQSALSCNLAIYSCIFFYGLSKVLIYLFLIEKVVIVWPNRGSRWSSPAYLVCLAVMSGFFIIIVLMILGKIAYHRADGQCVIGLKKPVSITLLTYDLFLNVFLTGMFLWPLSRRKLATPAIRRVASRTLVAALAALTTSAINVAVITALNGIELGWVCLGSCGADVTLNAIILYWATSPSSGEGNSTAWNTAPGSYRPDKGVLPRSGYERQRLTEITTPSSAQLSFFTPGSESQSHNYPSMLREEGVTELEKGKEAMVIPEKSPTLVDSQGAGAREETISLPVSVTTAVEADETRSQRSRKGTSL